MKKYHNVMKQELWPLSMADGATTDLEGVNGSPENRQPRPLGQYMLDYSLIQSKANPVPGLYWASTRHCLCVMYFGSQYTPPTSLLPGSLHFD